MIHLKQTGEEAGIGLNIYRGPGHRCWQTARFAIVLNFPYWYVGKKFYYDPGKNVVQGRLFKFLMVGLKISRKRLRGVFIKEVCRIGPEKVIIQAGKEVINWLEKQSIGAFDRLMIEEGLHHPQGWGPI